MMLKTRFRTKRVKGKASSSHPSISDAHASKKLRLSQESPVEEEREEVEKELSVSLHQGIVLLLFQSKDEVDFMEVKNKCGIDDPTLRLTLQSLACGKKKVLKKIPPGRDINDDDVFVFNEEFPIT
jgi:cullin-4